MKRIGRVDLFSKSDADYDEAANAAKQDVARDAASAIDQWNDYCARQPIRNGWGDST